MNLTKITQEEYAVVEEKETVDLKINNTNKTTVDALLSLCEKWLVDTEKLFNRYGNQGSEYMYAGARMRIGKSHLSYTVEDIHTFSIYFSELKTHKLFSACGQFISALINNHYNKTKTKEIYEIVTSHLNQKLNFIGQKNNGANITVLGDVKDHCGLNMKKGTITVQGDCEDLLGVCMKGGRISVENTGIEVGMHMKGGKIEIRGICKGLSDLILDGLIYHNGKWNHIEHHFSDSY